MPLLSSYCSHYIATQDSAVEYHFTYISAICLVITSSYWRTCHEYQFFPQSSSERFQFFSESCFASSASSSPKITVLISFSASSSRRKVSSGHPLKWNEELRNKISDVPERPRSWLSASWFVIYCADDAKSPSSLTSSYSSFVASCFKKSSWPLLSSGIWFFH